MTDQSQDVLDQFSANVWAAAASSPVFGALNTVQMPSDPFDLPLEGEDPTVYYVPEVTRAFVVPTLSTSKLSFGFEITAELYDNSPSFVWNVMRGEVQRVITRNLDNLLINGDTAQPHNNINCLAFAYGQVAPHYLTAFDGLRKHALVHHPTMASDAGAKWKFAAVNMKFNATRMLERHASENPRDLTWFTNPHTVEAVTEIADGAPVVITDALPLTSRNGKEVCFTGTNLYHSVLCVYRPNWVVGYRPRVQVSVRYLPVPDRYALEVSLRLGMTPRKPASAAILYGIAAP